MLFQVLFFKDALNYLPSVQNPSLLPPMEVLDEVGFFCFYLVRKREGTIFGNYVFRDCAPFYLNDATTGYH